MIKRLLKLPKTHSFFLFGARNTGKSSLVKAEFDIKKSFYIDLLNPLLESQYTRNPMVLYEEVMALDKKILFIIIDEVQKCPKLLDVVHMLIEKFKHEKYFILTGSSARKLKQSGVNLLAGRAFIYHLYPFSFLELKEKFTLDAALEFGLLPEMINLSSNADKRLFLFSYAQTYLKEEVWSEQVIRKLDPFRHFLEVTAQMNGKIINANKISNSVGVDHKTVENYFTILQDTLVGYVLPPFHHSFRKRLSQKPKFYFFDVGVTRALANLIDVKPKSDSSYYGEVFEHFIVTESMKLANYYHLDFRFSYLATKDQAEIDLVVERPGKPMLLIEIKSSNNVDADDLKSMKKFLIDLKNYEAICLCQNKIKKKVGEILVLPWMEGIRKYFTK